MLCCYVDFYERRKNLGRKIEGPPARKLKFALFPLVALSLPHFAKITRYTLDSEQVTRYKFRYVRVMPLVTTLILKDFFSKLVTCYTLT